MKVSLRKQRSAKFTKEIVVGSKCAIRTVSNRNVHVDIVGAEYIRTSASDNGLYATHDEFRMTLALYSSKWSF